MKSLKTDKPEKPKHKPLWGKVFYIDVPSVALSEKLQKDIKDLGGVSQNQTFMTAWENVITRTVAFSWRMFLPESYCCLT